MHSFIQWMCHILKFLNYWVVATTKFTSCHIENLYLHPPSKFKIYSMTDDTRYSTTENLIIANGWSKVKSGEC